METKNQHFLLKGIDIEEILMILLPMNSLMKNHLILNLKIILDLIMINQKMILDMKIILDLDMICQEIDLDMKIVLDLVMIG